MDSKKTPEMERFLDEMSEQMFGRRRSASKSAKICVMCGGDATEFRNELSRKEYEISGLCQRCQDAVFKEE